mmetsp:Transcript_120601/g.327249  ORF Transcript_120601/g.327249 Transcript_120601/m.327249 type:complete len:260 (-) Transcript_120601:1150-1929(-)
MNAALLIAKTTQSCSARKVASRRSWYSTASSPKLSPGTRTATSSSVSACELARRDGEKTSAPNSVDGVASMTPDDVDRHTSSSASPAARAPGVPCRGCLGRRLGVQVPVLDGVLSPWSLVDKLREKDGSLCSSLCSTAVPSSGPAAAGSVPARPAAAGAASVSNGRNSGGSLDSLPPRPSSLFLLSSPACALAGSSSARMPKLLDNCLLRESRPSGEVSALPERGLRGPGPHRWPGDGRRPSGAPASSPRSESTEPLEP